MARLPIHTHPDPVLRQVAAPVEALTDELRQLIEDMTETMYVDDGVGLAAPQVGRSVRLIVCDPVPAEEQGKDSLLVLINPEIVERSGKIEWQEGCLSVPDVHGKVIRSAKVVVRARNAAFEPVTLEAEGLAAVCLQHEIDHLDGVLFFDRMSPFARKYLLKDYEKARRDAEDA